MKSHRNFIFVFLSALLVLSALSCTKSAQVDDQQFKGWIVGQAASGFGTILTTSNDGLTWIRQGSQAQAAGVDLFDVHGFDQNMAWVVGGIFKGYGLILHTSDGGLTWSRQGTASQLPAGKLYAVHATSGTNVWAAGEYSAILRSVDGGTTWTAAVTPPIPVTTFYAITSFGNNIWVAGSSADTASGGNSGMILHSSDGGTTWALKETGSSQGTVFHDISAASDSIVYVAGSGGVLKSGNGGNTWINILPFSNRNMNGICAVDVQNVWAVGDRDGIFHTVSGGSEWDSVRPALNGFRIMGVTVADVNRVWIVGTPSSGFGTGNILYSRNAGDTWFIEESPVQAGFRRISFSSAVR